MCIIHTYDTAGERNSGIFSVMSNIFSVAYDTEKKALHEPVARELQVGLLTAFSSSSRANRYTTAFGTHTHPTAADAGLTDANQPQIRHPHYTTVTS